jgi:anti-sigma regulatory factor (Ser/Thr protein kinase)
VDHPEELARLALPAEPASVGKARRLVAAALRDVVDDEVLSSALVVTSELVTNAMLHARTDLEVAVRRHETGLRVEVQDGSPRLPRRKRYSEESGTGRGLVLVESLSSLAGAEQNERGKLVWALLVPATAAPPIAHRAGASDEVTPIGAPDPGVPAAPAVTDAVRVAAADGSPDLLGGSRDLVDA